MVGSDFLPWVRTHTRHLCAHPLIPQHNGALLAARLWIFSPGTATSLWAPQSHAPSREDNLLKSFSKIKWLPEQRLAPAPAPSGGILNDGCQFGGASS